MRLREKDAFFNWFLQAVHDGVLDPKLTFFTDEAWFHLSGYINAQNNRCWSSINPKQTFKVPLHDQKIGAWRAITASLIAGSIFFKTLCLRAVCQWHSTALFREHYGRRKDIWLFYARWCYSTYCHLFHWCFKRSVWRQTDKSRIVACKVSRLKSLWFLSAGNSKRQLIQIIPTHWLNLNKAFVKQFHLSRSVNWNWTEMFPQDIWRHSP
jgi:hypothetical protein